MIREVVWMEPHPLGMKIELSCGHWLWTNNPDDEKVKLGEKRNCAISTCTKED